MPYRLKTGNHTKNIRTERSPKATVRTKKEPSRREHYEPINQTKPGAWTADDQDCREKETPASRSRPRKTEIGSESDSSEKGPTHHRHKGLTLPPPQTWTTPSRNLNLPCRHKSSTQRPETMQRGWKDRNKKRQVKEKKQIGPCRRYRSRRSPVRRRSMKIAQEKNCLSLVAQQTEICRIFILLSI